MGKQVTERDFRKEEFKQADPKDYEFRDDGAVVRKDRWESGIRRIASGIGFNARSGFEVKDVVTAIKYLLEQAPNRPDICIECGTGIDDGGIQIDEGRLCDEDCRGLREERLSR